MEKLSKKWILIILPPFMVISICIAYIFSIPQSASWFHYEDMTKKDLTIGIINMWFYNTSVVTPLNIYGIAPTRYFPVGDNRPASDVSAMTGDHIADVNFNKAVKVHKIYGANKGDIDILVDIKYEDTAMLTDILHYYIFVPVEDEAYVTGGSKDCLAYINSLVGDRLLFTTEAQRRAKIKDINDNVQIPKMKNMQINIGQNEVTLGYLLYWTEYDSETATRWGNATESYPIPVAAHPLDIIGYTHQINEPTP